jgi:hypothetical protein
VENDGNNNLLNQYTCKYSTSRINVNVRPDNIFTIERARYHVVDSFKLSCESSRPSSWRTRIESNNDDLIKTQVCQTLGEDVFSVNFGRFIVPVVIVFIAFRNNGAATLPEYKVWAESRSRENPIMDKPRPPLGEVVSGG